MQRSVLAPTVAGPRPHAQTSSVPITRRTALATVAAVAACRTEKKDQTPVSTSPNRMPVVFLPHGGGPWPFVEMGFGKKEELTALADYLRSVKSLPKTPPKA